MRKILFYLFIINLLISCTRRLNEKEIHIGSDGLIYYNGNKYTGEVFDVYKNGRKKVEMKTINGIIDGVKTEWFENGNISIEENYSMGKKNGVFKKYSPDGNLVYIKNYKNDIKDGYWEIIDNIFSKTITNYKEGKRDGYFRLISEYGDSEGFYKNDLQNGLWKYYDYYKRLIQEIEYKKGKKNGKFILYNPENGEAIEKGYYKEDIPVEMNKDQNIKTVRIGKQIWMSENLKSSFYQNGEPIIHTKNEEETASYKYLNNDPEFYGNRFGKLYNWLAVIDKRGICPKGFKIPTKSDWMELFNYLGEDYFSKIKSNTGWDNQIYNEPETNGTNESGLNIIPLGDASVGAVFWTSSQVNTGQPFDKNYAYEISIERKGGGFYHQNIKQYNSCRCIKID